MDHVAPQCRNQSYGGRPSHRLSSLNRVTSFLRIALGVNCSMNRLILRIAILTVLCPFTKTGSAIRSLRDDQPAGEPTVVVQTIETPLSDAAPAPNFERALPSVDHAAIAESIMPLVLPRDNFGLTRRYKTDELSYAGAGNGGPDRASGVFESSGDSQSPKWTTDIFAGAAFADQQGELYTVGASFERRVYKEWSIAFQPFGGVGVGKSDASGVIGLDALLKHPIYKNKIFTVNFEGGGGIQYAGPKSWPRDGSHFNWRPQAGFGVRFNTDDDCQLLFGARYIHISNGGVNKQNNSGIDEIFLYGGFRLTF